MGKRNEKFEIKIDKRVDREEKKNENVPTFSLI